MKICRTSTVKIAIHERQGFTVLELLAVIGIIALVMSSFVVIYANYNTLAKGRATRTTIQQLDTIVVERLDGFRQRDFTDAAARMVSTGVVANIETAKILTRKQEYRRSFPQNTWFPVSTVAVDNSTGPFAPIRLWINNAAAGAERDRRLQRESAACLYTIITLGPTYGTPTVDGDDFSPSQYVEEVDTANGNRIRYFVDSWGEPLRFYRSPTRLFWLGEDLNNNGNVELNEDFDGNGSLTLPSTQSSPIPSFTSFQLRSYRQTLAPGTNFPTVGSRVNPLQIDPDDPLNRLLAVWQSLNVPASHNKNAEFVFHTPSTYWTPLIISSGPDRILGIAEPTSSDADDEYSAAKRRLLVIDEFAIQDNITNLNINASVGNE